MYLPDYQDITLRQTRVYEGIQVKKISTPAFLALSLETVADFLKMDRAENPNESVTDEDATLTMVIQAVTAWWEHHMGTCLLRAPWRQTQNAIKDGCIALRRGPALSVTSIYTIAGFTATTNTPQLMSPSLYTLAGNEIYSENWPLIRNKGGVYVNYMAGLVNWQAADENNITPEEIAEFQSMVDPQVRLGLLNTIGHLMNNREGQKPTNKYEIDSQLAGLTPANTQMLGLGYMNVSLTGKCWK